MFVIIKFIVAFVGLSLTCLAVLCPIELLLKQMCTSQCIYLQRSIKKVEGSEWVVYHESPIAPKSMDENEEQVRILIWVLTGPSRHTSHALHVKRTWGAHFDKLLFMSSEEDDNLGTIVLPNVTEGHDKLWPKTQKAFKYVWEHHKDDADWFMKADDDTFVVSHNLHAFLKNLNPNEPHYLGHTSKWASSPMPVNYGGTGYILSKAALKLFIEALQSGGDCHTEIRKTYKGDEDTELGICMKSMNVSAESVVDDDGRHQMIFTNEIWDFDNVVANFDGSWPDKYNKWSPAAISFHKASPSRMYMLEYLAHIKKNF